MLKKSEIFAINGTPIYTPDAPFPFAFGHLQSTAGRSMTGYTVKNTVRYGVASFESITYSKMTVSEFQEMYALFMQQGEYFYFTFFDPTIGKKNTIEVYCNNCSGGLYDTDGDGIVKNVTFSLIAR